MTIVEMFNEIVKKTKRLKTPNAKELFVKFQDIKNNVANNIKEKKEIDKELNRLCGTIGGILPTVEYCKMSNGYMACLTIYKYIDRPENLWILSFLNQYVKNDNEVIVKIDIQNYANRNIKKEINDSIKENGDLQNTSSNVTDMIDSHKDNDDLMNLYYSLKFKGEVVKNVQTRLYIYNQTVKGLMLKIKKIQKDLETRDYKGMVMLGRTIEDYKALSSSNVSLEQPIPSYTLSKGFPFNDISFEDKNGQFLGLTPTKGAVILNTKLITKLRASFDIWLFGDKGMGKTTFLKDYIIECMLNRDRIFFIDIENQLTSFAKKFGGKVIDYSKKEFAYNFLEILKVSNDSGFDEDFRFHLSKLKGMFKYLLDEPTEKNLSTILKVCKKVYEEFGFFNIDNKKIKLETPLLEDVVKFMQRELKFVNENKKISEFSAKALGHFEDLIEELEKYIDDSMYGNTFNVSTHYDLQNENFVVIDISSIRRDDEKLKRAQLFNMNNILYNEMLKNYGNEHFLVIIYDEAKNFVSPSVPYEHLDFIDTIAREDRKYNTQQIFATQTPRDVFMDKVSTEKSEKLKSILEQSTYRIFYRLDNSAIKVIEKMYPHIPKSYLEKVSYFGKGDALLDIANVTTLQFNHDMTKKQLQLYDCK